MNTGDLVCGLDVDTEMRILALNTLVKLSKILNIDANVMWVSDIDHFGFTIHESFLVSSKDIEYYSIQQLASELQERSGGAISNGIWIPGTYEMLINVSKKEVEVYIPKEVHKSKRDDLYTASFTRQFNEFLNTHTESVYATLVSFIATHKVSNTTLKRLGNSELSAVLRRVEKTQHTPKPMTYRYRP